MSREKSIKTININLEKLTALELEEVTVLTNALLAVRNVREEHQAKISGYTEEIQRLEYKAKEFQESAELTSQEVHKLRDANKQLKSQLEKQQPEIPEVPQEVAGIYEKHAAQHHRLSETLLELYSCRLLDMTQGEIDDLVISMKLYGYSVKGKRFYLKSDRELESRGDTCIGYVTLYLNNDGYFTTNRKRARKFIQSEIDSMDIGSCEKVEVTD